MLLGSARGMAKGACCLTASLSTATPHAPRPRDRPWNMPDRGPNNERAAPRPRHRRVNHTEQRQKEDNVYVGWDWASEAHDVTALSDDGETVIDRWQLAHDADGIDAAIGSDRARGDRLSVSVRRRPADANRRSFRRRRGGGALLPPSPRPARPSSTCRSRCLRRQTDDLGGDLGILSSRDPRPVFDHCHRAPETTEELPELEADVAATEDDQVRRELLQVEDAVVVEPGDIVQTRDRGLRSVGSAVEEHLRRARVSDLPRRARRPSRSAR